MPRDATSSTLVVPQRLALAAGPLPEQGTLPDPYPYETVSPHREGFVEREGVRFDSQNDSEVGARFVASRLAQGEDLEKALLALRETFDGFYTLLVTSADGFAVVRDPIACKPAVVAETDAWVAMASEFRALAGLPGIESARLYEPEPGKVYAWTS